MRFYLSSFRIGEHGEKLAAMTAGGILAYVPNALDHIPISEQSEARDRNQAGLQSVGIASEVLDLRDYFGETKSLADHLSNFVGVWVSGGNTFVLRQAMALSGFDKTLASVPPEFIYGGYSAGVCVLAPELDALQIVDDPKQLPYSEQREVLWQGLGILNHIILPHYQSDHPESADIDKEVAYCRENRIAFKTLRDGEVLYGDDIEILNRGIELSP